MPIIADAGDVRTVAVSSAEPDRFAETHRRDSAAIMSAPELLRSPWRKSSHSGGAEGECVEIADLDGRIGIRDSKNLTAEHLTLTRRHFTSLLAHLASQPSDG
ncbi:DUF397 domain-containing protein [Actinomadura sp. NPDC048032]|uniref:DUF397 domain-containing protein n=1 Tax=Actinomadura sp. NPDC048032 TaxID=3155747 RepID=UPI00340D7884